jgi:hypothetical protein
MNTVDANVLRSWFANSPHRGMKLPAMRAVQTQQQFTQSPEDIWNCVPIEPATPLSCLLYLTDPMYSLLPVQSRPSMLRETCTELELSFQTILHGRKFPVRRTADAIVAASTGGSDACSALGWKAMAGLYECQIVWFDETQKLIQFYPEAVSEWTSEKPIYFCSHLANQVWIPPKEWKQSSFATWLSVKEQDGWRVKYDEAEGTVEELKELSKKIGFNLNIKVNKAELQKKLGKARAIKQLGEW